MVQSPHKRRPQAIPASYETRNGNGQGKGKRGIEPVPSKQHLASGRVEIATLTDAGLCLNLKNNRRITEEKLKNYGEDYC